MFIQTETTPNPATLKFLPGTRRPGRRHRRVSHRQTKPTGSPLAARLFTIDGVGGVFLGSDFITVTKADGEWPHLKPAILGAIMEHFMSGAPVVGGAGAERRGRVEFYDPEDEAVVATIKELIETRVRPAVAQDGGDITFSRLPRRRRVSAHARGLRRLPVLDGHVEATASRTC